MTKITIADARDLATDRLEQIAADAIEGILKAPGLTEAEKREAEARIIKATANAYGLLERSFTALGADA